MITIFSDVLFIKQFCIFLEALILQRYTYFDVQYIFLYYFNYNFDILQIFFILTHQYLQTSKYGSLDCKSELRKCNISEWLLDQTQLTMSLDRPPTYYSFYATISFLLWIGKVPSHYCNDRYIHIKNFIFLIEDICFVVR